MLHFFSFKNFFSFREGATVSFSYDGKTPESVTKGQSYSTIMAIKGANGSGKTNSLKVVPFLSNFCTKSFERDPDSPIMLNVFANSADPAEFEIEFSAGESTYLYQLACTDKKVLSESLQRKKNSRYVKLFERNENSISQATKEFALLKNIRLRSNASAVSIAHQHEVPSIVEVHQFFRRIFYNVGFGGLMEARNNIKKICEFLNKNSDLLPMVVKFISECDIGINDITIHETKDDQGKATYFPIFHHNHAESNIPITEYEESSGTKLLFRILPEFFLTLGLGSILIVDELDNHLHPHIIPKLVGLFENEASNPKNAQLLFSTHDSDVLDLLGKYRICLVNKEGNESYLYRLDELPGELVRNDRPISPLYKSGKLGGTPAL